MGEEACMEVVRMRWHGLQRLRQRTGDQALVYQSTGGTELFRKEDHELQEQCFDTMNTCNQLIQRYTGLEECYSVIDNTSLPGFNQKAIFNQYEGLLQPVNMMQRLYQLAIAQNIQVLYGVEITRIDAQEHVLHSVEKLTIGYKTLILCTNGFTKRLRPDMAVVPARNQVLITDPLPGNPLVSGYHVDKGYIYFREYQGRILLGGGRNMDPKNETTDTFGITDNISTYLNDILDEIYPGASSKVAWRWSGILGIGPSKKPIIEWIEEDVLAGVRLGGMGVAIGSWLGDELAQRYASGK